MSTRFVGWSRSSPSTLISFTTASIVRTLARTRACMSESSFEPPGKSVEPVHSTQMFRHAPCRSFSASTARMMIVCVTDFHQLSSPLSIKVPISLGPSTKPI